MSKKLLDILPTLQTFQDNVISQLTNMFNGAEWLNDTTSYTKQETIYKLLMLKYGDRYIRYDDENIFLNRLVFDLADFLPDIYAKQQVFIKNKLNEFLSDNKNRAVIIDNTSTNNRNTDNNTKFGNSSSPLNLVISNANEITNAPITSLNLSNVKLLENYNGSNQQVNYNFVNDLIKTLSNDYSLRLNEFMELLGKHFISVVGSYYRNQNDIQTVKDEPYRFNNGYLVNEVDYLCSDNKQEINRFNEKLGRLNDQVATKQNQLTAGNNISINNRRPKDQFFFQCICFNLIIQIFFIRILNMIINRCYIIIDHFLYNRNVTIINMHISYYMYKFTRLHFTNLSNHLK